MGNNLDGLLLMTKFAGYVNQPSRRVKLVVNSRPSQQREINQPSKSKHAESSRKFEEPATPQVAATKKRMEVGDDSPPQRKRKIVKNDEDADQKVNILNIKKKKS